MGVVTLQAAKTSLQILSTLVKAVPIPEPFKSAVVGIPDAVLQIITIVENAKGNMEDAKVLALYIATITDRTIRPLDLLSLTPATQNRICEFQDTLQQITDEITILASGRSLRKWIFNYDRDTSKLGALKQRVVDAVAGIQLETVVATSYEVDIMSRKQDFAHEAIIQKQDLAYREQQGLIRKQQDAEINQLIALLGSGDSGSSRRPPCLDGTRVSLLRWISRWIEQPLDDEKCGLCLIGAAGRGKSAVGASVAETERASKRLGGEFYFTVDEQDRNKGVIPVLARQLASWGDRRLRVEIASAVDEDREIAQRALEVQFKKLIQEPLETLADDADCRPLVIILDGLDECNNQYATRLLRLIGKSFATLPASVRFIITSRPEPHLLQQYDSEPLDARLFIRSLDAEDTGEVEKDIETFLKQELPQMVWGMVKRPSNWPGEERRTILIRLSGRLWIWVVTVARMLADPKFRDPEKQLDALLLSASNTDGEYGHNTDLYTIYSQIVNRACPPESHSKLLTLFRDVFGALCVVKDPINTHTLDSLLCLDHPNSEDFTDSMRTKVLGYLQSVLIIPDIEEDSPSCDARPIKFIHKSFKDYLMDRERCEARFLVNIGEQHRQMAIRCMCRMEDLRKPNICDIDPSMLNNEIGKPSNDGVSGDISEKRTSSEREERLDIKGLSRRHISPALQYACENWANHVSGTPPESDDVYTSVDTFARTRLLYWLEVLSLLGMTGKVKVWVESAEIWLKARPQQVELNSSELPAPTLLRRITTFVTKSLLKLQVTVNLPTNIRHLSTGPPSPRALNHAQCFPTDLLPIQQPDVSFQATEVPKEPDISSLNLLQDLKSFVSEFEIPISTSSPHIYYSALPFTPSDTSLSRVYGHLAEGGPKPRRGCLQQWSQLRAQSSLAWSPDGRRIVSGSWDGTLRLWDPATGTLVRDPWKSTQGVMCVAWSPDGKMIVSGGHGHTLELWDSTTGARIGEAWKGHTDFIWSLAWSPDSKWVVSGSHDETFRVWDSATGETVGEAWKDHASRVWCVVWSPDGKSIASGSNNGVMVHQWDPSMRVVTGRLWEGRCGGTYGLAWSPDGKKIVSVNEGGTLRLWDACTGGPIGEPWKGHTSDTVSSVAWSPDGKTIISGSGDNILRLWDALTGASIGNPWQGHTHGIDNVRWSPDGKTIASGSKDGAPLLWTSQTGDPIRLGQRGPDSHTRHVYRLAFAHDSNKIATASSDGTLRLWDTSSGAPVGPPAWQTARVTRLDFSLHSKYVISEDEECRTIWKVAGEETRLVDDSLVGPISEDHSSVLKIDRDGWIRDPGGKRMFWLPVVLRPMGDWGRVLVKGNTLAIEVPSVPIIDISAYGSRF
ncbi:hypothetical protein FRB94_010802 [Tulasnella sp. JGI-2019a]|nr:hypothetical protein FRB94_010802 [Tulasnella sp. JGI-2019a]